MPCCLDCLHFKMKKGWKVAYCVQNILADATGKERFFKVVGVSKIDLTKRGRTMDVLNQECVVFDNMGDIK